MKNAKNIAALISAGILVVLFLVEIVAAIHSTWFVFTHIHLTRMKALFDPGNYMGYKVAGLVLIYLDYQLLKALTK